ncbi:phosphate ABC transporter membrane protein 2, PhoT family [Jatrophihabitans endophyticus]|uniref:Phosphate transport system permease protein PstA n=1 Tax=Jatrophihabitans endophyticus TaxID=1206085 RepID=A0A1M5IBB4_9ACTN|nr:phosphate ABC transporter permease PstA [Jatrophihabitans endophyticus]SHG25586.1 phosphate ABC transporter membrane protein 2, PhoT family [Jatrophihabitans endophyticus]
MTAIASPPAAPTFAKARGSRRVKNNVATTLVWLAFAAAMVPLVWLLVTVIGKGYSVLAAADWWTSDQTGISQAMKGGGISAAIIGTAEQVALCTVISVPIGILVGVYLVEYGGRGLFARVTTFMVDILTGIPSIVAALFIYALFITTLGGVRAGWMVSLALVILMIPVLVRTTEEMLKLVPNELREASYALGIPKWKTIARVVIPTALTGLITGVVLGIARVAGETAPLLILVGYAKGANANLFGGFQSSLPGFINDQFLNYNTSSGATAYHLDANGNRVAGAVANYAPERMWGAALSLILIVLALNLVARLIGRRTKIAA